MSLTHHTSGLQPATSDIGEHLLAEMTIVSRDLDYGLEPRLVSRERQSRLSFPICLLYHGGAGS